METQVIELAYALDTFYFLVMGALSCGWLQVSHVRGWSCKYKKYS